MRVSSLSFGASSLGGVFHSLKEEDGIAAVHTAVDHGINFIDVSPYYGHYKAETVLGKAITDSAGAERQDCVQKVAVPAEWSGDSVETYMGFISEDGKEVANSMYLGSVAIA